jgi:hypothetical protein
MQTLHLRFRDLRAILLGGTPSRWPTPSAAKCCETKGPPGLSNSPRPTSAVGAHPKTSHQRLDRCPTLGAGLTMTPQFREPRVFGADAPDTSRVCWSQTAENNPHPAAHHTAGQDVGCSLQAPFSEVARSRARPSPGRSPRCSLTPSTGLSFPLRPQLCGARAYGEKTADLTANVGALAGVSSGASWRCERALRPRLRLYSVAC